MIKNLLCEKTICKAKKYLSKREKKEVKKLDILFVSCYNSGVMIKRIGEGE